MIIKIHACTRLHVNKIVHVYIHMHVYIRVGPRQCPPRRMHARASGGCQVSHRTGGQHRTEDSALSNRCMYIHRYIRLDKISLALRSKKSF